MLRVWTVLLVGSMISIWSASYGGDTASHATMHGHQQIDVANYAVAPTLSLEVIPDAVSGWNVHLSTTNFKFAPQNVNRPPVEGEGHAHFYVDGKKIARVYSEWFHVSDLPPGKHQFRATLNANNHAELALHGKSIEAITEIIQE